MGQVEIKSLEWTPADDEDDPNWEVADTIIGRYSISHGKLLLIAPEYEELVEQVIATDGDLKAIARADYERRIFSTFTADPRAQVKALSEALRNARGYVLQAVEDDGGIDNCEIGNRLALEQVDAALRTVEASKP